MVHRNALSQHRRNYDDAIRVMQRVTAVPQNKDTKANYYDHIRFIAVNIMRDLGGL